MYVKPGREAEFDDLCANFSAHDAQGRDIVALVKMFASEHDQFRGVDGFNFGRAWSGFLDRHKHQVTVMPMVGLILYLLVNYWGMGEPLYDSLPTLERMTIRDTLQDLSDEIKRSSEDNGEAVLAVP